MSMTKAEKAALFKKNLAKAYKQKVKTAAAAAAEAPATIPPDEHDDEGLGLEDVPAEPVPDFVTPEEQVDVTTQSEPAVTDPDPKLLRAALVRIHNSPLGCVCGTLAVDQRTEHVIDTLSLHSKDCAYVIAQQALSA